MRLTFLTGVVAVVVFILAYVVTFGHLTVFKGSFMNHPSGECVLLKVDNACMINTGDDVTDELIMQCAKWCVDNRR